ncbi:hypothetical protein PI125_g21512 [Phytophthora idaei]|nr:hypothetical protein PI125_g21512 [Phytophthora idaei]
MPALGKKEAAIEGQGRGALLPVSEDTNEPRTSQESHPSVDELSTSEILSRPTLITREVKEEIEVARSEDLPTIRPDLPSTCSLLDLDPTPGEDLGHSAADHSRAERLGAMEDEQICYHEGGDLYAEDVGEDIAVVPDVPLTTEEVKIEVLYELREVYFAAMTKPDSQIKVEQAMQIEPQERLDERRDLESSRPDQAEHVSDQVKLETDHGAPNNDRSVSDEVQGLSGVELRVAFWWKESPSGKIWSH